MQHLGAVQQRGATIASTGAAARGAHYIYTCKAERAIAGL